MDGQIRARLIPTEEALVTNYEIRILNQKLHPSLSILGDYASDREAISHAKKCAGIRPADVWRDRDCIYVQPGDAEITAVEALKIACRFLRNSNLAAAAFWTSVAAGLGRDKSR